MDYVYQIGEPDFLEGYLKTSRKFWGEAIQRCKVICFNGGVYHLRYKGNERFANSNDKYCFVYPTLKEIKERIVWYGKVVKLEKIEERIKWVKSNMPEEDDEGKYYIRDYMEKENIIVSCEIICKSDNIIRNTHIRFYEAGGREDKVVYHKSIYTGQKTAFETALKNLEDEVKGIKKTLTAHCSKYL